MRNTFHCTLGGLLLFALGAPHFHFGIVITLAAGLVVVGLARDMMRSSDEKKDE